MRPHSKLKARTNSSEAAWAGGKETDNKASGRWSIVRQNSARQRHTENRKDTERKQKRMQTNVVIDGARRDFQQAKDG